MARLVWSDSALDDLDDITEYIALDNLVAAKKLMRTVFNKVDRLKDFPNSGRKPPELGKTRHREFIVGPCRVLYRHDENRVAIVHVMQSERELRKLLLRERDGDSIYHAVEDVHSQAHSLLSTA